MQWPPRCKKRRTKESDIIIINPNDFRRKGIITPGKPAKPIDNGIVDIVDGLGRHAVVLTNMGWMRLAVLLIKKYAKDSVCVQVKDITEMPLYSIAQKFDINCGDMEIEVTRLDESDEEDSNDDVENETE